MELVSEVVFGFGTCCGAGHPLRPLWLLMISLMPNFIGMVKDITDTTACSSFYVAEPGCWAPLYAYAVCASRFPTDRAIRSIFLYDIVWEPTPVFCRPEPGH